MVVITELSEADVDRLFHALADTTRRDILRRAVAGELSVSRLSDAYPMSFAAVQKHVAVLAAVGLVTKERRGRETLVRSIRMSSTAPAAPSTSWPRPGRAASSGWRHCSTPIRP